jgi:hypothetical protein
VDEILAECSIQERFIARRVVPPAMSESKQLELSDAEHFRRLCDMDDAGGSVISKSAQEWLHNSLFSKSLRLSDEVDSSVGEQLHYELPG